MPAFEISELLAATGAELHGESIEHFEDIVTDTRKITEGTLFVALSGERFNGEDFAAEAVEKGAAGVVVSRGCPREKYPSRGAVLVVENTLKAYQQIAHAWRMKFDIPVIAITGSNGKTTTKDLVAAVLSARGPVCKTQANFNNEVGLPLTLLSIRKEHVAAVVEIGMRGRHQIEELMPIAEPSIGIVTNVGETHIELLGSIENIARAKCEMVEGLPDNGTVILNADDQRVAAMAEKAKPGVRVMTFGIESEADIRGESIHTDEYVTRFTVCYNDKFHDYVIPLLGMHNVYNALAAVTVGFAAGLSSVEIHKGFLALEATKMRFECSEKDGCRIINDAYNASPMSMKASLETAAKLNPESRLIAVLGDMLELGDISESAHREVGQEVGKNGFSTLITYGDMSRWIDEGARAEGVKDVRHASSHEEAAEMLKGIVKRGDTVLFKGSRGMKMEKILELVFH